MFEDLKTNFTFPAEWIGLFRPWKGLGSLVNLQSPPVIN